MYVCHQIHTERDEVKSYCRKAEKKEEKIDCVLVLRRQRGLSLVLVPCASLSFLLVLCVCVLVLGSRGSAQEDTLSRSTKPWWVEETASNKSTYTHIKQNESERITLYTSSWANEDKRRKETRQFESRRNEKRWDKTNVIPPHKKRGAVFTYNQCMQRKENGNKNSMEKSCKSMETKSC